MDAQQIELAIRNAQRGIAQYLEIMRILPAVNVAENRDFQRKFNHFYRVRQRPAAWYATYYSALERWKNNKPGFAEVLDYLHGALGRYEPSFSSKLVATLDPEQPVWDRFVLEHTGVQSPPYTARNKLAQAKAAYVGIQAWYREFLASATGRLVVELFDAQVPEHGRVTDLKKVDFVLWQMRG